MRWHKDVTSRDLARDNSTGVERKDANAAERWVGGSRSEDTRRTQRVLAESFDIAACLEIFKIKKKKIKEKKGKCRQRITRFSRSPPCFPPQTLEAVIAGLLPFSYWRRILLPLFYLCLERPYKATLCAEENWDLSFFCFYPSFFLLRWQRLSQGGNCTEDEMETGGCGDRGREVGVKGLRRDCRATRTDRPSPP